MFPNRIRFEQPYFVHLCSRFKTCRNYCIAELHKTVCSREKVVLVNDGSSAVMLELGQASLHLDLSCPGVGSIGCTGAIQDSEGRFQLAARSVKELK